MPEKSRFAGGFLGTGFVVGDGVMNLCAEYISDNRAQR